MENINKLIQKYNKPGPRYTSYPAVPFWNNAPSEEQWITHIQKSYRDDIGIDLYVHVPFCESLCYYCGCNRTITKNHEVEDFYLEAVLKEWELYKIKIGHRLKINSLHFGGGTPTFLSPKKLETLILALLQDKSSSFIGSIEIDPRTCQDEHLEVLSNLGIKRVSLGIQDFDKSVQKSINRDQSPEMISALMENIRKYNFSSINFDLIYGLPKQTQESITKTIEIVAKMAPDLIAFYSYAHLPEKIKNQRLIVESDLPGPEEKRKLYEQGAKLLFEYGYVDVGMDHFAKPSSFLYQAVNEKRLHRNFMGYVDKKSPILIGLGPSSISDSSLSFVQNVKDLKNYIKKIQLKVLPLEVGHTHSPHDLLIQEIILQIMCHNEIDINDWDRLPYWTEINKELQSFREDGIIEINNDKIMITAVGKGFVRNLAMSFDFYLREQKNKVKFSQTV